MVDPCESTLFSWYVDVDGMGFPCSFTPGTLSWNKGINMTKIENFENDVWHDKRVLSFRDALIDNKDCNGCRECLIYSI